jgi:hypothetical protein
MQIKATPIVCMSVTLPTAGPAGVYAIVEGDIESVVFVYFISFYVLMSRLGSWLFPRYPQPQKDKNKNETPKSDLDWPTMVKIGKPTEADRLALTTVAASHRQHGEEARCRRTFNLAS